MPLSFDSHDEGCRPLSPCRTCKAVAFLKTRITDGEMMQLDAILFDGTSKASLDTTLERFHLSVRTRNCLHNENIKTIRDLLPLTDNHLLRIPNFGRKSLKEIHEALETTGWKLGDIKGPQEPSTSQ